MTKPDHQTIGASAPPVALITGGAKRIGYELSTALAHAGYAVAIHANGSINEAQALAKKLEDAGAHAKAFQADLSDAQQASDLVNQVTAAMGQAPAVLINNASTFVHDTAADFTSAGWDAQHAVNLRAPALLSKAFAAATAAKGPDARGCIINMLDQRVAHPTPAFFSYMLSKSGLEALTRVTAIAYAPQVRVCAVAPGLTLPSGGQTQADFEQVHNATMLGRGSQVQDVAQAVLFLLKAQATTGQVIYVDGGQRLGSLGLAKQATAAHSPPS